MLVMSLKEIYNSKILKILHLLIYINFLKEMDSHIALYLKIYIL